MPSATVVYRSISSENFGIRVTSARKINQKYRESNVAKPWWWMGDASCRKSLNNMSPLPSGTSSCRYFLSQLSRSSDEVRLDLFFKPAGVKSSVWSYLGSFAASRADVPQETQVSAHRYDSGDNDNNHGTKSWWHHIFQNRAVSSCCGEGRQPCVLTWWWQIINQKLHQAFYKAHSIGGT